MPATEAEPEAEAVLTVTGLEAGYHGIPVVRGLDLQVRAGEVVALLGSNGAGKTTTLMTVAGLLAPLGGSISFDGESIGGVAAHRLARRGLSLVPEDRALFAELTVRENLRLARAKTGSERDVLDLLPELTKCLDRKAGLLSGGEQQMLAVGRALVTRPKLLVVDEMSLGLAPVVVERLLPVLRRVAVGFGTGVLVVEQHVTLALDVAERAYVLAHGRLVLSGTAAQLRDQPDLLTASYLGDAVRAAPST
ncbi:ABC transporter ATP-binding protein [Nocardioides mangrovicus]|uniref:ABC transporter ATP-binding protein n=1 Tax=Nocardioides mangrovicus TaxID=2478913 RepID=A0A3L8P6B4_9ACTN|nr:ABC transporter ATP-binding protein [Nocardioides mangrovicus]RLV50149.1 ABC transporter ATP-binding protein [Nocardioides mangrovicus]